MRQINVDYWYTFGRAMSLLEECFAVTPCDIDARDWSRISTAIKWLKPIAANDDYAIVPGTQRLANDLSEMLSNLVTTHNMQPTRIDSVFQAQVNVTLTAFHNVLTSGAQEIFTFLISGRGAYSAKALLEDASSHLSDVAQKSIVGSEKRDFDLAGACLACVFSTATGFHAMRALEAEARRYHMAVTGLSREVDWTLSPLVNGNSGKGQFGLRDQWKKEGARDDAPLLLIITLLSSITQIYRNPIMHPEMTLTLTQAKQVFDTAALVISAMVEDRKKREETAASPAVL
jgi:hypothetical protein